MRVSRGSRLIRITRGCSVKISNMRVASVYPGAREDDLDMRDQFEVTSKSGGGDPVTKIKWGSQSWCRSIYISITVIVIIIALTFLLTLPYFTGDEQLTNSTDSSNDSLLICPDNCKFNLLESIPTGRMCGESTTSHKNHHDSWLQLISSAKSSIDILSHRFILSTAQNYCSDAPYEEDEDLFTAILKAGRDRGVKIRILLNVPDASVDSKHLVEEANAQVKRVNLTRLLGEGVMHAKSLMIDRTHYYFGSADLNRYSLEAYKELGLLITNCSCLVNDIAKIFDGYWELPEDGTAPNTWPESLATKINIDNPAHLTVNGNRYQVFVASSPRAVLAQGRTFDLDAMLYCINNAKNFVDIAAVKYYPLIMYNRNIKYWPIIDDALRRAAIERKVHIRLLINRWQYSKPSEINFLKSLTDLTGSYENVIIEAKFFTSPALERTYFGHEGVADRVLNHARYIVTDSAAYIGTSNLSGEYFDSTGIGLVLEDVGHNNTNSIKDQLEDVFQRDWTSNNAYSLDTKLSDVKV